MATAAILRRELYVPLERAPIRNSRSAIGNLSTLSLDREVLFPSRIYLEITVENRAARDERFVCRVVFKTGHLCSEQNRTDYFGRLVKRRVGSSFVSGGVASTE